MINNDLLTQTQAHLVEYRLMVRDIEFRRASTFEVLEDLVRDRNTRIEKYTKAGWEVCS